MKAGTTFQRDGRTYEILKDEVAYISTAKSMCIRDVGKSRGMKLESAIETGIIREIARPIDEDDNDSPGPLFERVERIADGVREPPPQPPPPERKPPLPKNRKIYYIPVSAVRAQLALARGIILPHGYDNNDGAFGIDSVSSASGVLPLFNSPPRIADDQVLLHILLTDEEIADSRRIGECILYEYPLPVSRIGRIGLPNKVKDVAAYIDEWLEDDVPIPKHLCIVETENGTRATPTMPAMKGRAQAQPAELREALVRFDRYMGLFAFMRNAARYTSRATGTYADYPMHYFQLANLLFAQPVDLPEQTQLSPLLQAILGLQTDLDEVSKQMLSLMATDAPYIEKTAARKVALALYEAQGKDTALQQAFKALFEDDYRVSAQTLTKANARLEAAMLTALFAFSDRQSNDHRNVKQNIHTDWPQIQTIAHITALLGAHYGYRKLDALETRLYAVESFVADLVETRPVIKFHLTSTYERQLIEAVYQWAFYRRKLDTKTAAELACLPTTPSRNIAQPSRILVNTKHSYQVGDIKVNAYELTPIARCLRLLLECPGDFVDQNSEVGHYLMAHCFFHADDYELSRKAGREVIRYSIRKSRLVDLVREEKIRPSVRVMNAALEADMNNDE